MKEMNILDVLGLPREVLGAGYVYPIKVVDADRFYNTSNILTYSKATLSMDNEELSDIKLLDLLLYIDSKGEEVGVVIESLIELIRLCTRCDDVIFDYERLTFMIGKDKFIDSTNYDEFRKIVMEQNLVFEPRTYKNKHMQRWAEKARIAKSKNSPNISLGGMLNMISVITGKKYSELKEYTLYQVLIDFRRINMLKEFDVGVLFRSQGADLNIPDYTEDIDLYKHPDEDLFKDKSKSDVGKL